MLPLVAALLIGIIAGLRTFMAPAAVSLAAHLGPLNVRGAPLAFLGHPIAAGVLVLGAVGELVGDQLPSTPSRKTPAAFAFRIVSGALSGAAIATPSGMLVAGGVL